MAETNQVEERILSSAKSRNAFDVVGSATPTPPPLPESLPPGDTVKDNVHNQSQIQSGAARLDLLVGGVTTNGSSTQKMESKEGLTTKRVSFVTSTENVQGERKVSNDSSESQQMLGNNDDKLYRLERAEEKGPNVSIFKVYCRQRVNNFNRLSTVVFIIVFSF